jgi:hypothetical protein
VGGSTSPVTASGTGSVAPVGSSTGGAVTILEDGSVVPITDEVTATDELTPPVYAGGGPFVATGPNSTAELFQVLQKLQPSGIPIARSMLESAGPFPVGGLAYWTDDWHACRDGCSRLHQGLDIFAEEGTPLVAAADGVVTQKMVGETAGMSIEIQDAQGTQYFYAHLSGWAEPINVGDSVRVGQVLGYVGHTGNAIYTPPHLHFEYQPGGVPAPPKPQVDTWAALALQRAEAFVYVEQVLGPPPEPSSRSRSALRASSPASAPTEQVEPASAFLARQGSASCGLTVGSARPEQMAWEMDWLKEQQADVTGADADLKQSAVYLRLRWLDCLMDTAAEKAIGDVGD